MYGDDQNRHTMKLSETEYAWGPKNQPELLLVLPRNQRGPKNWETYLTEAESMLARLVREADPDEVEEANRRIRESLTEEEQVWLPPGLLDDPKTPRALMRNPASLGSSLHSWKQTIREALTSELELMTQEEAKPMAEEISLESFLSRLL